MFTVWQVRFLGGFTATRGDEIVSRLRTHTVLALFAFLCAQPGRDHGREELVVRFWPDADDEAGRAQLRVALNALRRAFEPPPLPAGSVLETTRTHVRLRPESIHTDVRAFETALKKRDFAGALRLYEAGIFLPGVYDEWISEERERLEALAEQARVQNTKAVSQSSPPLTVSTGSSDTKGTESFSEVPTETTEPTSRLPLLFDCFFGREAEIARLEMLLVNPTVRLVCVTGPGGAGKTRIAIEAARRILTDKAGRVSHIMPGGAYFVPLAAITDGSRVVSSLPILLRDALGIEANSGGNDPLQSVEAFLKKRRTLVVLDNAEQIADALSLALPSLLARLPSVTFLVTTRSQLSIRGTHSVTLGPLQLPESDDVPLSEIAGSEAVALFVDRARQAHSDWGLTVRNAPDVVSLARLLEGSPLGLELAASWAGVLTPRQMRAQIARRGEAEKGTNRLDALPARREQDRVERHRSLRAAVAWSYDLLPPDLQTLWARLSVFRGGWTTEAAQIVCDSPDVPASLARLLQQSLAIAFPSDEADVLRFDMPQALREFASEQLNTREDVTARQSRHAAWILSTVADAPSKMRVSTINTVGLDNCRAALSFLLGRPENNAPTDALRLCVVLWDLWYARGFWDEAKAAFTEALDHTGKAAPPNLREAAWRALGALALYRAEYQEARYAFDKQLSVANEEGRASSISAALSNLAAVSAAEGNLVQARDRTAELLQSVREDPYAPPLLLANVLNNLGTLASLTGDEQTANEAFTEGLTRFRLLGEPGRLGEGACLTGLGAVAGAVGDLVSALAYTTDAILVLEQAGEIMRAVDARLSRASIQLQLKQFLQAAADLEKALGQLQTNRVPEALYRTFNTTALLARQKNRMREAVRLQGAGRAWREEHSLSPSLDDIREQLTLTRELQTSLGEATYNKNYDLGQAWSREETIAAVLMEAKKAQAEGIP